MPACKCRVRQETGKILILASLTAVGWSALQHTSCSPSRSAAHHHQQVIELQTSTVLRACVMVQSWRRRGSCVRRCNKGCDNDVLEGLRRIGASALVLPRETTALSR